MQRVEKDYLLEELGAEPEVPQEEVLENEGGCLPKPKRKATDISAAEADKVVAKNGERGRIPLKSITPYDDGTWGLHFEREGVDRDWDVVQLTSGGGMFYSVVRSIRIEGVNEACKD